MSAKMSCIPGTTWWKERTDSFKRSSDIHMCTLAYACLHTHNKIKCNQTKQQQHAHSQKALFKSSLLIFFLQSSFHGSRKYCSSCQWRESIKQSYPAVTSMNCESYQHSKIGIKCNKWHSHVGGHRIAV